MTSQWNGLTRKPLRAKSQKRQRGLSAYRKVRSLVLDEANPCFLASTGCFGVMTPHHLLKSSQGGLGTRSNLVALCVHHNGRIEDAVGDERQRYIDLGLIVSQGTLYRNGRYLKAYEREGLGL